MAGTLSISGAFNITKPSKLALPIPLLGKEYKTQKKFNLSIYP